MEIARQRRSLLLPVFVLLLTAACESVGPGPRPGPGPGPGPGPARTPVGRVHVDAPSVLVNNRAVAGTVTVFLGDDVRTDGRGRATISFDAGGSLVIGPDTDPLFQLVSEAGCVGTNMLLQVIIGRGTFDFFNVTRVCFCNPGDVVCGAPASDFRVVVTNTGTSITVSRGALRVTVGRPPQPRQYRVPQGQGIVVQKGRTSGPQTIVQ